MADRERSHRFDVSELDSANLAREREALIDVTREAARSGLAPGFSAAGPESWEVAVVPDLIVGPDGSPMDAAILTRSHPVPSVISLGLLAQVEAVRPSVDGSYRRCRRLSRITARYHGSRCCRRHPASQ